MRWLSRIKQRIGRRRRDTKECDIGTHRQDACGKKQKRMGIPYNPCNPYFRNIIEQVLAQYQIAYGQLRLVVIDAEEEDGADRILIAEEEYLIRQMTEGLNHLCIYTNRPEYFAGLDTELAREYGLLTELRVKSQGIYEDEGLVLDFERSGYAQEQIRSSQIIYIPIYKNKWEQLENLDIAVPIGYNTVIVKGTKTETFETSSDRLEREFYAE